MSFAKIHGESGGVDSNVILNWSVKLKDLILNVDVKNIFNGDELGLFWRLLPNKSYVLKYNVCKMGKQSKERFTVFVCANMLGEKLPMIIIGKYEKPRQWQEINKLNFFYYHNSTAWMNRNIFADFVSKLNQKMLQEKRHILLFIDNCSAHPTTLSYSNVKILFLLANTTSVTHPMGAGVIKCLKVY